ncbi:dihydroorotase [Clostridium sp. HCP1S3_B4]|uniref:dihydroorotase n=1 Tax=unclassified Clostridium TaxID=2614128 RepID=UPI003F8BE3EA
MILIKNGRVIDPKNKIDEVLDIVIKDDKIIKIGKVNKEDEFEKVINATNMIVAPGLIDVHVHFRDPGFTYKEDIFTGSESAAKGGFTSVVCMANTNPIVDNEETLKYILDKAKETKINIYQAAAISKEFKGKELVDMKKLKELGAVGFTDDGIPLRDGKIVLEAMEMAKELDVPLSFHEEDPSLMGRPGVNDGEISKKLGFKGATRCAEDALVARDCMIALNTGAKVSIQHISSGNSVEMIRFIKSLGAKVYAEATPHHFSLTEEAVLKHGTLAKMNPPLRTLEDQKKIIEGLKDNTIEIIATDHAPHSKEEKERELLKAPSGIIGLETSLPLGVTNLVKKGHLSMMELLEKMTINPAKLYNLDAGSLEEGKKADIVIFDDNNEFTVTNDFASKAQNTPFVGAKLYGKVKVTIANGKIAYEE